MFSREEEEAEAMETLDSLSPRTCGKGHRSSLLLRTCHGGSVCLVCLSLLLSSPSSPTVHVSHALSQISLAAAADPSLLRRLRSCHARLLVSPLARALCCSSFDEPIARQIIELVSDLCGFGSGCGSESGVSGDFIARISDHLSESVGWSRRHIYSLD